MECKNVGWSSEDNIVTQHSELFRRTLTFENSPAPVSLSSPKTLQIIVILDYQSFMTLAK